MENRKLRKNTKVPPKLLIDLLKVCGENLNKCFEIYKSLGLVNSIPSEISITEKKVYEPGELKEQFDQLTRIVRYLGNIDKRDGGNGNDEPAGKEPSVAETVHKTEMS